MITIKNLKEVSQNKSVLYIEDEKDLRDSMTIYLEKLFARVISAEDGRFGLQEYKKNDVDIVITDIFMPNLDGLSMLKEIIKINPNQKVIIFTASTDSTDEINALKIKNLKILIKPTEHDALITAVYQMLTT